MRWGITLCVTGLLLAGCASGSPVTQSERVVTAPASSTEPSAGVNVPADDPSLELLDAEGRSPGEAVLALIDAKNRADWQAAYSVYATPEVDFETAEREWIEAEETHDEFRVLEVRVTAADAAWVRVTYRATTKPPGGEAYPVVVGESGEWWPVHKVDGVWKTQWMPRQ